MTSAASEVSSDAEMKTAFAAAREICRRDSGFAGEAYRSAFFLPRGKRDAIYAIAAFAGLIRQAVSPGDEAGTSGGAGGGGSGAGGCCGGGEGVIAGVKSRIDALYTGPIELPLPQFRDHSQWTLAAMAQVAKRFEIPRAYLHDFTDGLTADRNVRRYATWTAVRRHCELVGGSLAKIAACVLGVTHSDGAAYAEKIGVATRLAQILRTLVADLKQDRLYLPLEDLVRFGCAGSVAQTFLGVPNGTEMNACATKLVEFEVARARELLREGSEGLCWLAGDGSRMSAAMWIAKQNELFDAIERAGLDPRALDQKPAYSPARKLRQLSAAWRLARRTPDEPLPPLSRVG